MIMDSRLRGNDVVECGNDVVECGNDVVECGNDVVECGNDVVECGNDVVGCGNDVVDSGLSGNNEPLFHQKKMMEGLNINPFVPTHNDPF